MMEDYKSMLLSLLDLEVIFLYARTMFNKHPDKVKCSHAFPLPNTKRQEK